MKHYRSQLGMQQALVDQARRAIEETPVTWRGASFNSGCRITLGYNQHFHLDWELTDTGDGQGVAVLLIVPTSSGAEMLIRRPEEARGREAVTLCEALVGFEATFTRRDVKYAFYGFGIGCDEEYHRRLCELVGVGLSEATLTPTGTRFVLHDALSVNVPHPFFRDKGVQTESTFVANTYNTVDGLRDHMGTLRKAMAAVELIERTLG